MQIKTAVIVGEIRGWRDCSWREPPQARVAEAACQTRRNLEAERPPGLAGKCRDRPRKVAIGHAECTGYVDQPGQAIAVQCRPSRRFLRQGGRSKRVPAEQAHQTGQDHTRHLVHSRELHGDV